VLGKVRGKFRPCPQKSAVDQVARSTVRSRP
jgi:hypothetical protein